MPNFYNALTPPTFSTRPQSQIPHHQQPPQQHPTTVITESSTQPSTSLFPSSSSLIELKRVEPPHPLLSQQPYSNSFQPRFALDHERIEVSRNTNSKYNVSHSSHAGKTTSNNGFGQQPPFQHLDSVSGRTKSAPISILQPYDPSSMTSSNNSSTSNNSNDISDTSVLIHENGKFGDEFLECDEFFLHLHPSWPVYVYKERDVVFMRVLCIKTNTMEVVVFDPFSKRVFQQCHFRDLKKISFDTNDEQDCNTNFRLFRIQFNKMDTLIFLSKDRNDIFNCLLYYAKEFREQDTEEINIEKNPSTAFTPDINVALHHFQVFGIDRRGRFFPHILSLYSNHVRHVDSETKKPFSTHGYSDVEGDIEIDPDMPTKLTIRYINDHPYSFLVSDKDRSEILALLQGRCFIYRPQSSHIAIVDGVELNTSLGELNPMSDFPHKLVRNVTSILEEPEKAAIDQSGFHQKVEVDNNELVTESNKATLDFLQRGAKLFMHVPKKLALVGKKTSAKQVFVKIFLDKLLNKVVVQWGKSSDKLNRRAYLETIEEGKSTIIESSKISHYHHSNYSFILYVDCKEKSWTLGGRLFLVANGSVEYRNFIDGTKLLIEQQQKIHRKK